MSIPGLHPHASPAQPASTELPRWPPTREQRRLIMSSAHHRRAGRMESGSWHPTTIWRFTYRTTGLVRTEPSPLRADRSRCWSWQASPQEAWVSSLLGENLELHETPHSVCGGPNLVWEPASPNHHDMSRRNRHRARCAGEEKGCLHTGAWAWAVLQLDGRKTPREIHFPGCPCGSSHA